MKTLFSDLTDEELDAYILKQQRRHGKLKTMEALILEKLLRSKVNDNYNINVVSPRAVKNGFAYIGGQLDEVPSIPDFIVETKTLTMAEFIEQYPIEANKIIPKK